MDIFDGNDLKSAFRATLAISLLPSVLLLALPADFLKIQGKNNIKVLNVLLCFAAGGLLGDVFLHALPHLFEGIKHDDHHELGHEHSHSSTEGTHEEHSHSHGAESTAIGLSILLGFFLFFLIDRLAHCKLHDKQSSSASQESGFFNRLKSMSIAGWLNIIGDALHNFTDGIAIGVTFHAGNKNLAVSTVLSVLMHEIPHELGDFAVLIESGLSKTDAILAQGLTAIAAFFGTYVGYVLSDGMNESLSRVLLSLTCGGFVYLSAAVILPSIKDTHSSGACSHSKMKGKDMHEHSGLYQTIADSIGFLMGVTFMVYVAAMESHDHDHDHH